MCVVVFFLCSFFHKQLKRSAYTRFSLLSAAGERGGCSGACHFVVIFHVDLLWLYFPPGSSTSPLCNLSDPLAGSAAPVDVPLCNETSSEMQLNEAALLFTSVEGRWICVFQHPVWTQVIWQVGQLTELL